MLTAAFITLCIAVLLGAGLAFLHLREGAARPAWPLGALHGLIALGGLGCLLLSLRGPPRGVAQGTASFAMIAAVLLALAALFGAAMVAARLRQRRITNTLIGVHATLAVGGFAVLLAYVLAG